MSNSDKKKVDQNLVEEENEDSNEQCSREESALREVVIGLPALSLSKEFLPEEENLNEMAVAAAQLVMAAADGAVMQSGGKKKKTRKPRKTMSLNDSEAGGSGIGGKAKKPKRKASGSSNPHMGAPRCNRCGRIFRSWIAVNAHMSAHNGGNYQGFCHPPPIPTVAERMMIPGPNSAFVLVAAGGGSSGGIVAGGGSAGGDLGGEHGKGLGVDLNVDLVEEDEEEVDEYGSSTRFDLNKSPPRDES